MRFQPIIITFASFLGSCPALPGAGEPRPVEAFLKAIREVESGDRADGPPGRLGELGAYQFRRQVWRRYTAAPFPAARTSLADRVAVRHYAWLRRQLERAGVPATEWNLAAAWNSGVRAVCSGRIPYSTRDYATRVYNLVAEPGAVAPRASPVRFLNN